VTEWTRWSAGAALAIATAFGARATRSLGDSGAAAAAILGTLAVGAGWTWGILLVAYFASSSVLSGVGRAERDRRTAGRIEKTGPRDAVQVMANGGVFGVAAVGFIVSAHPLWPVLGAGALAASAADTWATEIGTLARSSARSILTARSVPTGTSGGITVQGLMAGVAGAAFVGGVASACGFERAAVNAAVGGGVLGMLLDSVLGASVQSRRWCATCASATEQRVHRCGSRTEPRGGLSWLDNDGVNAVSTLGGALAAVLIWST
jgi:uncharacterized protein (TIGR00297 family)